jgi:hypothetical protein
MLRYLTVLACGLLLAANACYEGDPNAPGPPDTDNPPIVTGVTPLTASPGDVVTITGQNFGNDPSRVSVTFGAVHVGQVLFLATTNMDVRIPAGASGLVQIVVVVAGQVAIGPSIVVT